jgi:hypothetical protein
MQRAGGKVLSTKEQKIKNATSKARGSKTATSNYNKVEATRLSKTTKPKSTKSRGSNTPKQIGDQNQREGYNSVRGKSARAVTTGKKVYASKLTKTTAKKSTGAMTAYKQQRAGGKGK